MAYKCREEIVGKRFLSLSSGFTKIKGKARDWNWRAGVIRAATHRDNSNPDLQVLVEYDDVEWQRREWISVYRDDLFHLFLVEQALVWADRRDPFNCGTVLWPALTFLPLVSKLELPNNLQPLEFLLDRELAFKDYSSLKPYYKCDTSLRCIKEYPDLQLAIKRWTELQDGQRILLTTPSVLMGYRVEVYRAEGTTQWYTAVIIGYNEATRDLTVTDDTVLEEHNEDPSLVQMRLIGDGVVESIMRGDNVGITPRRSRSSALVQQRTNNLLQNRVIRNLSGVNNNNCQTNLSRRPRQGRSTISDSGHSPEPPDKGLTLKKQKRKVSEADVSQSRGDADSIKEDLENKQTLKKTSNRIVCKKKVLEEATNSKLRQVEIVVEDCIQNGSYTPTLVTDGDKQPNVVEEIKPLDSASENSDCYPINGSLHATECDNIRNTTCDNLDDKNTRVESLDSVQQGSIISSNSVPVQSVSDRNLENDKCCVGEFYDSITREEVQKESVSSNVTGLSSDTVDSTIERSSKVSLENNGESSIIHNKSARGSDRDTDCSIRGDDDGPLCSSSPLSRMDFSETPNSRFTDDRSDSGVSSLRSSSGDERSGSRSSALSSSDEPNISSVHLAATTSAPVLPIVNRSTLFVPAGGPPIAEPVRVWRDPGLLFQEEPHVRHVHSVQHQTLLMSHPQASSAGQQQPPTSAPTSLPAAAALYHSPVPQMTSHALAPHHPGMPSVATHPHLPPPHLLHHNFTDLWKQQRYATVPSHLLASQQQPSHTAEDLERERALLQERHTERLYRHQQEERHREKERMERERQEREKMEREKEKQERDREEKERQEQALQNHFEKSLRAAQQKREQQQQWNSMGNRSAQSRSSEEDRKQSEMHQRERHLAAVRVSEANHRSYYGTVPTSKSNLSMKADYPPPAHSRHAPSKTSEKLSSVHQSMIPKTDLSMYGYHPSANAYFEPKKSEHHKTSSGLVVTKANILDNRELTNSHSHEGKSTVIVKHDTKTPHHVEPRVSVALSPSPKLRNDLITTYMSAPGGAVQKSLYEYRSSSQSPHHLNSHTPNPHHHLDVTKSVSGHHRTSSSQMNMSNHQRQSTHGNLVHSHNQQHPSSELRYRQEMAAVSQAMMFPNSGKPGYPYIPPSTAAFTLASSQNSVGSKSKVSSPAPHHFYGKPNAVSVVPVSRSQESQPPPPPPVHKPLGTSISPSPYQQLSQYHHPPAITTAPPTLNTCPPPAHSSRTTSGISYDRYQLPTVKVLNQPGASPPAASAPLNVSRTHPNYTTISSVPSSIQQIQTQPLDLGISSNKAIDNGQPVSPKRKSAPLAGAPVCLEVKRRRMDTPPGSTANLHQNLKSFNNQVPLGNMIVQTSGLPQLARVSEPSPLIASAATTITTLVNTIAYRPPMTGSANLGDSKSPTLLTESLPDLSVTAVTIEVARPASTDSTHSVPLAKPGTPLGPPPSSSPSPAIRNSNTPNNTIGSNEAVRYENEGTSTPPVNEDCPGTPVRLGTVTPSIVDSEKSNSPGPQKTSSGSYPVRHLKKAWLQRHTGEDVEDTTGLIGSGICESLPLNIDTPSPPPVKNENPVNSIHSVGSMAVNSINKKQHFKTGNRKPKDNTINGHPTDTSKNGDDSSSSDQERGGRKSPPKRKPTKVKRRKGGTTALAKRALEEKKRKGDKMPPQSESGSDSDKESDSTKDSDSGASTTVSVGGGKKPSKEPRKRGRRPKSSKNDKGEEPRAKKTKDEPPRVSFRKPPIGQLKKTGESFLQDGPCFEVAPKLAKCRECRWTPNQRSRNMPNIFCRFYAFRKLRYTKNGQLAIAGFSDPHKDAVEHDIKLWLPNTDIPPTDLDLDTSRFLLTQVGDHFCDLLLQEKEANHEHLSEEKVVAWKRVVQGVREMCDVCETTLFNYHWTCGKCGFVVCLDCYKSRKAGTIKTINESGKDRDEFMWLLCTNRSSHEQEKLMLTQIIADDCLLKLGKMVHEMRELWGIEQFCGCRITKESNINNVECKEIVKLILSEKVNGVKKEVKEEQKPVNGIKEDKSSLNWLADVALSKSEEPVKKEKEDASSSEEEGNFSTLRELLIRPSNKTNGSSRAASPVPKTEKKKKSENAEVDPLSTFGLDAPVKQEKEEPEEKIELKHYIRRYNWQHKGRQQLPIRIMTLTESKTLYPNAPHSWLCDGKLLRLNDPVCKDNNKLFQDQWKRGQPVIVSDVCKTIEKDLWTPESFARDFGDEKNDLINCMTGNLVPNQPMRKFWEGFEEPSKRLKDERGQPMLLKLKDWPPGEDFADMLPTRFQDLMQALPLQEYTRRSGKLNLASRLPDCFVKPDLGPKMYNAYGSALHPNKGTTNLHLDISDAVNVMVYVGVPRDGEADEHIKEAFRAIDEAGCDILTRRRVRDKGELPGALWHIYNARDADKIRDLLNKVTVERGGRLEPHNDPIHDQSGYLDGPLRDRLYKEYGVEGYAIVQCLGDAVFIPAGAPHQVRNLHNCIKVAEDFVSPENVAHCFHLTQEFRGLSEGHSNHEDKLQIKNIIYHAVKDALSTLGSILNKRLGRRAVFTDNIDSSADCDSV